MHLRPATVCRYVNAVLLITIAVYFFLIPGFLIIRFVRDPGLRDGSVPRFAFSWHRSLSPRYERWARGRVAGGAAANKSTSDISGTEWPLFGSVFYLWATESLQDAWESDHSLSREAPAQYARGSIDAAAALIADPSQAAWVRKHWGEDYLHRENVFYRELLIAGLTCHAKLTGNSQYMPVLRDQVETLAASLDGARYGLLDDYPGECYPTDVLGAVAAIHRADAVLGTDHSAFARRASRAFEGPLLDPVGLPPYAADPRSGQIIGRSRGCGNSFVLIWVPALWPERAGEWYGRYERHYWQHRWTADGFREFPKDMAGGDWYLDVDSGPVLAGHGIAACAFGIGAARANGRLDHAYPLTAEMLVTAWPLLHGTLAGPRLLSNAVDAPYLGEAGVLFALTRCPAEGMPVRTGGRLPGFFWIVLAMYMGLGLILLAGALRGIHWWRQGTLDVPLENLQAGLWVLLLVGGIAVGFAVTWAVGLAMMLAGQLLPRARKPKTTPPQPAGLEGAESASP